MSEEKKWVNCDECGGLGMIEDDECSFCLGAGKIEVSVDETWEVSESGDLDGLDAGMEDILEEINEDGLD